MQNTIYSYFNQVSILIHSSKTELIILSVVIGIFLSFLTATRQKILFKILKADISISYLWLAGSASMLAALVAPFFAGSLTFAYLISKKTKLAYSKIFGIVLLDFIISLVFTVLFGLLGGVIFGVKKPLVVLVIVFLISALIFFIFKNKSYKALKTLIQNKTLLSKAVLVSLIIFILANFQGYLFFLAFGIVLDPFLYVLATAIFGLMNLIPGVPAKIGQYELVGTFSYWYLLNINTTQVSVVLLAQHAVSLAMAILIGIFALILVNKKK